MKLTAQLLLLFTIWSALSRKLEQYSRIFGCTTEDNDKGFKCHIHDIPQFQFRVTEEAFRTPLQIVESACSFICYIDTFCNQYAYSELITLIQVYAMQLKFKYIQPEQYHSIYSLQLKEIQHLIESHNVTYLKNKNLPYTQEKLPMNQIIWTKHISATLIFSSNICLDHPSCSLNIYSSSFSSYLKTLFEDMESLNEIAQVRVLYGYAFGGEITHESFMRQCKQLEQVFGERGYMLGCYGIPSSEPSMHYDIREELGQYAHKQFATDYYIYLDVEMNITPPLWLFGTFSKLLYGGYRMGMGIGFGGCRQMYSGDDFLGKGETHATIYPIVPILQRSHFEMFHDTTLTNHYFPVSLNNYLLYDAYSTLGNEQSIQCSERSYSKEYGDNLLPEYIEHLEDYIDQLQFGRYMLQAYFERHGDMHHMEDWLRGESASMSSQDTFFTLYCRSLASGCEGSAIGSGTSFVTISNGKEYHRVYEIVEYNEAAYGELNMMTLGSKASEIEHYLKVESQSLHRPVGTSNSYLEEAYRIYPSWNAYRDRGKTKVAVITAIYSAYEASCKPFAQQSIAVDFYCFTDRSTIQANGWIVDTTPYHFDGIRNEFEQFDDESDQSYFMDMNSLHNNQHPFNIAKYYKLSFHKIPVLQSYDVVLWLDGTIRITDPDMAKKLVDLFYEEKREVIVFEHIRKGELDKEAKISMEMERYTDTITRGYYQPSQRISQQYQDYLSHGYTDEYWKSLSRQEYDDQVRILKIASGKSNEEIAEMTEQRIQYGLWCTCFIAFYMRSYEPARLSARDITIEEKQLRYVSEAYAFGKQEEVNATAQVNAHRFLDMWTKQNRKYSTQDQVSFPYVSQMLHIHPLSLPYKDIYGTYDFNNLFLKLVHGQ